MLIEKPYPMGTLAGDAPAREAFPTIQRFMSDEAYHEQERAAREAEKTQLVEEAEPLVCAIEKRLHQEHLLPRVLVETGIHEEVLRGLLDRRAPNPHYHQRYSINARQEALQRLAAWLADDKRSRKATPGHAPTPTLRAIFSIIVEAMEASLLEVVVGGYGIGKSKAAEAVVEQFPRSVSQPGAVVIELRSEDNTVAKCLGTLVKRLRHDSRPAGGYAELCRLLRPGDVLILDEANYLSDCGRGGMVNVIRDLWKDTGAGVVLLGNPIMKERRSGGIVGNDLYGAFLSRAMVHDFTRGNTREDVETWMVWKGLAGKELAEMFVKLATARSAGEYGGIRRLEMLLAMVSRRFPGQEITSELVLEHMLNSRGRP